MMRLVQEYGEDLHEKIEQGLSEEEIRDLARRATELVSELFSGSAQILAGISRLAKRWSHARALNGYAAARECWKQKDVHEWSVRLACSYAAERFRSVDHDEFRLAHLSPRRRQLIRNDAQAILEVQYLNESGSDRRAVLISSSRGLHQAYRDWFITSSEPRLKPPSQYILRSPLQYLPLINLASFSRLYLDNSSQRVPLLLFEEIKDILNGFLDPRKGLPGFHRIISILHKLDTAGSHHFRHDLEIIKAQIEWFDVEADAAEFGEHWGLAYANAALFALPAVKFRRDEQTQLLLDAVKRAGGDHLKAQRVIVANIEIDHVSAMLWALGQAAAKEQQTLPAELRNHDVVRVLPILIPISSDTSEARDIVTALRGTVSKATEIVRRFSVVDVAQDLSPSRLLAGVCLSLALAEYDAAKKLSGRWINASAQDLTALGVEVSRDEILSEFRYLYGLAVRFDCQNPAEFDDALSKLNASWRNHLHLPMAEVRRGRASVEAGTLRLAAALREISIAAFGESRVWPKAEPNFRIDTIPQLLKEACDNFFDAKIILDQAKTYGETIDRLKGQAAINILCAYNLSHLTSNSFPKLDELSSWAYTLISKTNNELHSLKWISTLNLDAFEFLSRRHSSFPGSRSKPYIDLYSDERLAQFQITRRFIAGSDMDLLRLYGRELS